MAYGEILFQGTWGEALEHAQDIPRDRPVTIVNSEAPFPEGDHAHQVLIDEIVAKAKALPVPSNDENTQDDRYEDALKAKYRRQGFELR